MDYFQDITPPEAPKIDQQAIEDTIQTIMVDVVDELTSNEARLYESVERRVKNVEEVCAKLLYLSIAFFSTQVVEQSQNARSLADRKINNELRRIGVLVDSKKAKDAETETDLTVDVPVASDDLRVTMGSMQEQARLLDEQQQGQVLIRRPLRYRLYKLYDIDYL